MQVTANLHKRVARNPAVAEVYLLLAEALAGPLQEPAKAKAVATYALKTYPSAAASKALTKLIKSV